MEGTEPAIFRREDSPGFPGPLTNLLASKKATWYASLARSIGYARPRLSLPPYVRDMTCASFSFSLHLFLFLSISDDFIKNFFKKAYLMYFDNILWL